MWPNRIGLENHAQVALVRRCKNILFWLRYYLTIDLDDTAISAFEPGDAAKRGCLATAARSKQGHEFTVCDIKGNAMNDRRLVKALNEIANPNTHNEYFLLCDVA
jgi:hypothetical protein